jgi:hypothetical protein
LHQTLHVLRHQLEAVDVLLEGVPLDADDLRVPFKDLLEQGELVDFVLHLLALLLEEIVVLLVLVLELQSLVRSLDAVELFGVVALSRELEVDFTVALVVVAIGYIIRKQRLPNKRQNAHLRSQALRNIAEVYDFLLLAVEEFVHNNHVLFFNFRRVDLVLEFLQVGTHHVAEEELRVDDCVCDCGEGAKEAVADEVGEFVGARQTPGFGVHPDHCELVEHHFSVHERPHQYLTKYKSHRREAQYWQVSKIQ